MRTARPSCGNVFGRGNASTISSIPMCGSSPRPLWHAPAATVRVVNRVPSFAVGASARQPMALCCVPKGTAARVLVVLQ
jgi:hypothetical protein